MMNHYVNSPRWKQAIARGFTLVELMIAVAIIAIITAVALPAYNEYVTRSRLTEAFSSMATAAAAAEQYWSNQTPRTYVNFNASRSWPQNTANFSYALAADPSTFTITATGQGAVSGFVFTIDQNNTRRTAAVGSGWSMPSGDCWVSGKSGSCTN